MLTIAANIHKQFKNMAKYSVLMLLLMTQSIMAQQIDIQGHRGCRGLYPENTIEGFLAAIDIGVSTLELDVIISKDKQVVVSHEPYLNPMICLDPQGRMIPPGKGKDYNLYKMDYADIARCDCGTKPHLLYRKQKKMKVVKPLLDDMIAACEKYAKESGKAPLRYNIELKRAEQYNNTYHPEAAEFSDLVVAVIQKHELKERANLQSFDPVCLQYVHKAYPEVRLAFLTDKLKNLGEITSLLGFQPSIYSPSYKLLDKELVEAAQSLGMQVIPWTVNKKKKMRKLLKMGVDGIITDYPNKLVKLLAS